MTDDELNEILGKPQNGNEPECDSNRRLNHSI